VVCLLVATQVQMSVCVGYR